MKDLEKKFKSIQADIVDLFTDCEKSKNASIISDSWKRPEGGGGKTFVIQDGSFFDNCAVNFSSIFGSKLPKSAIGNSIVKSTRYGYQAMGVSVITHPNNPNIPTSHMNVRLFCILDKNKRIKDWWIGGGYDLTPYIIFNEDIDLWHSEAKESLRPYNKKYYDSFSQNCNDYFYIPHRKERRGVGGIFFDNTKHISIEKSIEMLAAIAQSYANSYSEIIKRRTKTPFFKEDKEFQSLRRGRYVEFNLVNDRGTAFGLQSNGRIPSILASLPLNASWKYKKDKIMELREKKLIKNINRDWNV
ncbi:oxygen-dependent coproporphyrinogen oxidase [Gammaproteobacteria bacterium]|nr:oxygen-dependent coproporphyrinogen oxidase [Gammaproteobacteria bacterium]MDC3327166.1 oxygen-dependent coproporphyrinogen oxidase [Gammaproteobacteria bacterium]MDC3359460.1 oxygen-dependent coproporphyrinogen oxidase [Gammaproteobacteria bacterium]